MPGFLIDSHNCTIGQCDNIEAAIEKLMEINLLYSEVKGDSVDEVSKRPAMPIVLC